MTEKLILEVREFVLNNFMVGKTEVENNSSLINGGIIDSLGVVEIINFVEDRYGVVVFDDEVGPNNFDSINKIASFIEGKTK